MQFKPKYENPYETKYMSCDTNNTPVIPICDKNEKVWKENKTQGLQSFRDNLYSLEYCAKPTK